MKKILQYLILFLLFITVAPNNVMAEGEGAYAYTVNENKKTYYYSINDAMNASRRGLTIIMAKDWEISSPIDIVEGTTSKIEMNGHRIKRNVSQKKGDNGHVILMHANSKLYLYGNNDPNHNFYYTGVFDCPTVTSGGLICGGSASDGGGIYMKKKAELHMENVMLAFNDAKNGGGIYVDGQDCQIYMDKKTIIQSNSGDGAGIYSDADGTHIHMNGNSEIRYGNRYYIGSYGAGVYFNQSWFSIESEDKTGRIGNNTAGQHGGAIYVCSKFWGSNNGTIKGLIIENNHSGKNGAGIYIDQNNVTIESCIIRNNDSEYNGAGVYSNGKTTISNTTITGNKCNQVAGVNRNYEGGGVYAASGYDIKITGSTVIRSNYRMNPNPTHWWNPEMGGVHGGNYQPGMYGYSDDDVFLGGSSVYILANGLDAKTSLIGIRTGDSGDRVVVKNLTGFSWGHTFFFNLANSFHFGGANNDSELWQRVGVDKYTVRVNGKSIGTYNFEQEVTINGNTKTGIFKTWESTNIDLTDKQKENVILKFKMPAYDVDLTATYTASSAEDVVLTVEAPVVGTNLYVLGSLAWTVNGVGHKYSTYLTWLEKQSDGSYKEVSGNAKANTTYAVKASIEKDGSKFLLFDSTDTSKVKVVYKNTKNESVDYGSASVDTNGSLNIQGKDIQVAEGTYSFIKAFQTIKVEEGTSKEDLLKMFPKSVSASNDLSSTSFIDFEIDQSSINVDSIIKDGVVVKPSANTFTLKAKVKNQDGIKLASDFVTFYINVIDKAVDINEIPDTTINVDVGENVYSVIDKLKKASKVTVTVNEKTYTLNSRFITNTKLINTFKSTGLINEKESVVDQSDDYIFEREMYASSGDNLNLKVNKARFIIRVNKQEDTSNQIAVASIEDEGINYDDEVSLALDDEGISVETSGNVHTYDGGYGLPSVNVSKSDGTYNSSDLTPDEDNKLSLNVELSPSEGIDGLKAYYNLYSNNSVDTNVEYNGSITLTAEKGKCNTYVLETWTDLDGEKSDVQTLNYVIDNSTRTITVISKYVEDGTLIEEPKVLTYDYGQENIMVDVPIVENYKIYYWVYSGQEAGQYNEDVADNVITVTKLTENETLTVGHYPSITKLILNESDSLDVGKGLPQINKVTAYLSNGKTADVTEYFDIDNVEWYPNDDRVNFETIYVAGIKVKNDEIYTKYGLSDDTLVTDETGHFNNVVYQEEDKIYVAFIYDSISFEPNYSIDSLEVLPYSDVTYENALNAGTIVEAYDIPTKLSAILVDNNTNKTFTYDLDVVWDDNFTVGFDSNNTNSQQLVIKGKLDLPDYIHNPNGLDTTITLTINVLGKDSHENKVVTCEEYMNSKNWTWSEVKKACVYMVSNTSVE